MVNCIQLQRELSQELPVVIGNKDYTIFRSILERMEEMINLGQLDHVACDYLVRIEEEKRRRSAEKKGEHFTGISQKALSQIYRIGQQALRCTIVRTLTENSFRVFSCRLADSPLLQRFCMVNRIDVVKVPSKSTLERYEKMLPETVVREIVIRLTEAASAQPGEEENQELQLENYICLDDYYLDTTCMEANIHYPVDWLLLRDITKTLMKAVELIRKAGLKNRMDDPQEFITAMNRLIIRITHTRRKKGGKKARKEVLRLMKKLVQKVSRHAEKHRDLLREYWEETELSEKETRRIVERIEMVLEQLPQAVKNAHDRIIGERRVANKDKILSLYDPDLHVIVRGKAGGESEFGNSLLLGEQEDGVIMDWRLYQAQSPGDSNLLQESLERMEVDYNGYRPKSITTDRGFPSQRNHDYLRDAEIIDYMCPRSVKALEERLKEDNFCKHQKRRSQTEGRVGIFKNNFMGRPLRSKGFMHRELSVAWGVLAHNLWVLARLPKAAECCNEYQEAA